MEVKDYLNFDDVLSDLGLGFYQLKITIIAGLIYLADGGEAILLSLVLGIITNEWQLKDSERSLTISFTFLGIMIGCYISGYFADNFGRRKCVIAVTFFILIFGIATSFSENIY